MTPHRHQRKAEVAPGWEPGFFAQLEQLGRQGRAADAAGVARITVSQRRARDPLFDARCADLLAHPLHGPPAPRPWRITGTLLAPTSQRINLVAEACDPAMALAQVERAALAGTPAGMRAQWLRPPLIEEVAPC